MKLFSDYHSHPQGHRVQPYTPELLQPWVESARKKGLRDIAFTDHDRYQEGVDFDVLDLVRQENPDVKLRAGIELDNDPQTGAAGLAWVKKNWDRLDFVLGSAHYLAGKDRMFDSNDQAAQFSERPLEEICRDYVGQVEGMISRGHIDCLAHLDLVKIHGFRPEAPLLGFFDPLLRKIKEADLAVEVNTAGWRKPAGEQYPEVPLLRRAVKLGIPITLSSDAHSHVQLAEDYARLPAVLQAAGVKEIALFEKHRRTMVPLA